MSVKMVVTNKSRDSVKVWLTLGAVDGCTQDVNGIFGISSLDPSKGYFSLSAGENISYTPEVGFNGNLAIESEPMNCPTPEFPNGINLFEFIINNYFQEGNPQETIDISCVSGVNAYLSVDLGGGGDWNAGPTQSKVTSIKNAELRNNTGLVGVYPYGCDDCTAIASPPVCAGHQDYAKPQKEAICNVQRDAVVDAEGIIAVNFLGMTK